MNAYIHYLLVDPVCQGHTIGSKLIQLVKEKYKSFMRIAVIGYNKEIDFYENCGFVKRKLLTFVYHLFVDLRLTIT